MMSCINMCSTSIVVSSVASTENEWTSPVTSSCSAILSMHPREEHVIETGLVSLSETPIHVSSRYRDALY